jgi:hypothetical protein
MRYVHIVTVEEDDERWIEGVYTEGRLALAAKRALLEKQRRLYGDLPYKELVICIHQWEVQGCS